jgi:hypothetical protein
MGAIHIDSERENPQTAQKPSRVRIFKIAIKD